MVRNINGFKVGFLNYTYGTNGFEVKGDVVVDYIDHDRIDADVKQLREAGAELIAACMHWGVILSRSFKLNRQTHEILKNEISRLEQGGSKKDVSPEARLVTEELTGHPYETLWPEKRIL